VSIAGVRSSTLSVRVVVLAVTAWLGGATEVAAQPPVPERGVGYVSLVYASTIAKKHYLPIARYDIGRVDSHALIADLTYGLTDRLAVSAGLPWVVARYHGEYPHDRLNPDRIDDGLWHSTWQDFRFGLSYNVMTGPIVLTPFVGSVVPSHGYEYYAHSAAGRQLMELQAGITLVAPLNRIHPGVYLQSRYSFGVVEQTLDVRPNHSNLDLELGYFVTSPLRVFMLIGSQLSHAGIDVQHPDVIRNSNPPILTREQIEHHDQIDRVNYLKVGGGASFELTDSVSLFGSVSTQVAGRNGHQMNLGTSFGMTWSFRTKKETLFGTTAAAPASPGASSPSPRRTGT
jgi:hypothetical protein